MFRRVVLDTNVYIDWLNGGLRDELVLGRGYVRYLSSVVAMELRAGARVGAASRAIDRLVAGYAAGRRVIAPSASAFDQAGQILSRLKRRGHEIRRSSLVHDVLIALTCRTLGATLYTANEHDFAAIRKLSDFSFEVARL